MLRQVRSMEEEIDRLRKAGDETGARDLEARIAPLREQVASRTAPPATSGLDGEAERLRSTADELERLGRSADAARLRGLAGRAEARALEMRDREASSAEPVLPPGGARDRPPAADPGGLAERVVRLEEAIERLTRELAELRSRVEPTK